MPSYIISEAINACKDFKHLAASEKEAIAGICSVMEFEAGKPVFSIDHQEQYLFIVVLGKLSLRLHNNRRDKFSKGDLFGEITLFSDKGRLGAIHCDERCTLVAIDKESILHPGKLSVELRLKIITALACKMAGYLYKERGETPTLDLLKKTEKQNLEFKVSTSAEIIPKIQETIVAFMNAKGGTILVGVDDKSKVVGLNHLSSSAIDKTMADLSNALKSQTKSVVATYFDFDVENINGKKVIRINVNPSEKPILYHETSNKEELLIVRTNNQNSTLRKPGDIIEYVQKRFPKYS